MVICEECLKQKYITKQQHFGQLVSATCNVCAQRTYCYSIPETLLIPKTIEVTTYDAFFQINEGAPVKLKEDMPDGNLSIDITEGTNRTINFEDKDGNTFKVFIEQKTKKISNDKTKK